MLDEAENSKPDAFFGVDAPPQGRLGVVKGANRAAWRQNKGKGAREHEADYVIVLDVKSIQATT